LPIRDLLADKRFNQAELDFLASTHVWRLVPAEVGRVIQVRVLGMQLSRRRKLGSWVKQEKLGEWEERPLLLPPHSLIGSPDDDLEAGCDVFYLIFCFSLVRTLFVCDFRQFCSERKWGLARCRQHADRCRER